MARRSGITLRSHTCLPCEKGFIFFPPKRRSLLLWRFSFACFFRFPSLTTQPSRSQPLQKHMLLLRDLHAFIVQSTRFCDVNWHAFVEPFACAECCRNIVTLCNENNPQTPHYGHEHKNASHEKWHALRLPTVPHRTMADRNLCREQYQPSSADAAKAG